MQLQKQWYSMQLHDGVMQLNHPIGNFSWCNNLALPAGFLLDADFHFTTKGHSQNIYSSGVFHNVNLTLTKSFLKDRLTARLHVYNLFESTDQKFMLYSGIRLMDGVNPQYRTVQFHLTYKFNTARSKYKGTGAGQEQKSRM